MSRSYNSEYPDGYSDYGYEYQQPQYIYQNPALSGYQEAPAAPAAPAAGNYGYGWYPVPPNWQPQQGMPPQSGYQHPQYYSVPQAQELNYQYESGHTEPGPVRETQGTRGKHSYSQNRNRYRQTPKASYAETNTGTVDNEYGSNVANERGNGGNAQVESTRTQESAKFSNERDDPSDVTGGTVKKPEGDKILESMEDRSSSNQGLVNKPPSTDIEAAEWLQKQFKTREMKQETETDNTTRTGGRFRGTDSRSKPFNSNQKSYRQQDSGSNYRRDLGDDNRYSGSQTNPDSSYRDNNRPDRSSGARPKFNDRSRYGGQSDRRQDMSNVHEDRPSKYGGRPDNQRRQTTNTADEADRASASMDVADTRSASQVNFARQSNRNNNSKFDREIPKSAQSRGRGYQSGKDSYTSTRDRNKQYPRRGDTTTSNIQEDSASGFDQPVDKAFSRSRDNYGRFNDMYNLTKPGDVAPNEEPSGHAGSSKEPDWDMEIKEQLVKKQPVRGNYESRAPRNKKSAKTFESQRSVLMDQLSGGGYDCMVCCETVRVKQAVWSCVNCYHVFHLRCIRQWARSPNSVVAGTEKDGWRCPACQNLSFNFPHEYRCFCGKVRDPEFNRMETPHSCGSVCQKNRGENCKHPCIILCHPGPCPECVTMITKSCACGKSKQTVKCGQSAEVKCTSVCGRQLNCGKHFCRAVCHTGSCEKCEEVIEQECYGGHEKREVVCGSEESFTTSYTCSRVCSKSLDCGNHTCDVPCHERACLSCPRLPANVTHCPCDSRPLDQLPAGPRTSCLDPVPTCDGVCNKALTCGPADQPHVCDRKCHEGSCGPCQGVTEVMCRCGALEKEFKCSELSSLTEEGGAFLCDKRCNRKKTCGRHKCGQLCCVRTEHPCEAICGRKLTCGLHKCEEVCHRAVCPPCLMASFDELMCQCGAEVMFPPIPCSTKPPECHRPCTRQHSCEHQVRHNCHCEESCPPCTELTKKMCMGGHVMRANIACHLTDISCGMACNKVLNCDQHRCIKVCHKGACVDGDEPCKQQCQRKRAECDHVCGAPCHIDNACPSLACKAKVVLKCACGHREASTICGAGGSNTDMSEYQKITMQSLADSLQGKLGCTTMDIGKFATASKSGGSRIIECNEECALFERNRRVALALEIQNPDLSAKLGSPSYSDFLKDYARQNQQFVSGIEKELGELVQAAKQSKHTSRSHSFPSMNNNQRRLIHELAEFYGCETQSYDYEPNKNVVATAKRDRCWLPAVTLTAYIQRELHPRAPPPIPHVHKEEMLRQINQGSKQSTTLLSDTSGHRSPSIEVWQKVGKKTKKPATKSAISGIDVIEVESAGPIDYATLTKESKDALKAQPVVDYFDFTVN